MRKFPDTATPDDVLAALAEQHPGTKVVHYPGQTPGFTLLWLVMGDHPLLSVREPGHGWPVHVSHYHGDATHRTDYDLCGPDHDPNKHRIDVNEIRLNEKEKIAEYEAQKAHTPIDTPQKLYDLCSTLLDGSHPHGKGHTAAVKDRAERHAKRYSPKPVAGPRPASRLTGQAEFFFPYFFTRRRSHTRQYRVPAAYSSGDLGALHFGHRFNTSSPAAAARALSSDRRQNRCGRSPPNTAMVTESGGASDTSARSRTIASTSRPTSTVKKSARFKTASSRRNASASPGLHGAGVCTSQAAKSAVGSKSSTDAAKLRSLTDSRPIRFRRAGARKI